MKDFLACLLITFLTIAAYGFAILLIAIPYAAIAGVVYIVLKWLGAGI